MQKLQNNFYPKGKQMILFQMLSKFVFNISCRHRETVICKYDSNGNRLPLEEHYHRCVRCGTVLDRLNYMHKDTLGTEVI